MVLGLEVPKTLFDMNPAVINIAFGLSFSFFLGGGDLNVDRVTPGCDCFSCRTALRQMHVGCLCLGNVACLTGFLVCIASVFVFTAANPPGISRTQPTASHFRVKEIPSSTSLRLPLCTSEPGWSSDLALDYRGFVVRFMERQDIVLCYFKLSRLTLGFSRYQGSFTLG